MLLTTVPFLALCAFTSARHIIRADVDLPPTCDSKIYCQGDLLRVVQMSKIHNDSKTFVDMSMRHSSEIVLKNFDDMMVETEHNPDRAQIKDFVDENFVEGDELDDWIPEDYNPNPAFLEEIADEEVRKFAEELHHLWGVLGKKVTVDVMENPDKHSLLPVPNGFIIPGGRFRECYYWDTYWIMEGLLISGMNDTVKGMLDNFLWLVKTYGLIPNGARVYYLQRSQPPLFTKMVWNYIEKTDNLPWLNENIEYIASELQFWLDNKFTSVEKDGKTYSLAIYIAESEGPRPESFAQDVEAAAMLPTDSERQALFNELKGAAQSGWDFTSRWFFDENGGTASNISHTHITRVLPVDLNAFLYGAFNDLSKLYAKLGNTKSSTEWDNHATSLLEGINAVLWDPQDQIWYDYDVKLHQPRRYFTASNLAPLWTKAYLDQTHLSKGKRSYGSLAVDYLKREEIPQFLGGIPTTKDRSGEQWDLPNAWPPLQSIVVQGLAGTDDEDAQAMAKEFAVNWVEANMIGFKESGQMYEKYDAERPGQYGGGGEYNVQTGFGWSNGVALDFIYTYFRTAEKKEC